MAKGVTMSFESDVKKFQKMWEATEANKNLLKNAQNITAPFVNGLQDLLPNGMTVSSINDIGGDFQTISVLMTDPYQVSGYTWTITKTLPETWIPNVRIGIGYDFQGSESDFDNVNNYFNTVVSVKPATDGSNNVVATWNIGVFWVGYDPTNILPVFDVKLYFVLVNPSSAY
jgi:hypothetical protein